ncbi:MAG: DUF1080 domain-containing protein [Rhodopirellula sp.]|nr:DUF1080 domain-containing protein [Rhodopirellula sp.]
MRATFTVLAILLGWATAAFATEDIPPRSHPDSSAWPQLFKEDLSNAVAPEGVWSVEDGVLTATEDQCLWTGAKYDDYLLDLEFKTSPGTNSGVIVHCSDLKDWIPNAVEIQIADQHAEKWANMPATWHCGAIFGHLAPKQQTVKKPGDWNRMTITCKGPMISVMLNGQLVTEMDMTKWTSAQKNPDGSDIPPWLSKPKAEIPTKGHIGFQGKHGGVPIYFRNIRIKQLD